MPTHRILERDQHNGPHPRTGFVVMVSVVAAVAVTLLATLRPMTPGGFPVPRHQVVDEHAEVTSYVAEEMGRYAETFAERMAGLKQQNMSADMARERLEAEFMTRLLTTRFVVGAGRRLREAYPVFTFQGQPWFEIAARDRELFQEFLDTVAAAHASGAATAKDPHVRDKCDEIIVRRRAILDACTQTAP